MKGHFFKYCCIILVLFVVQTTAVAGNTCQQPNYLNAVKVTFLSWTTGSTKVSYERALPAWKQSGEVSASVIGAGYDKYDNNPKGFTLRYGHKFFIAQNDISLKGFYLRPEIIGTRFNFNCTNTGIHNCSGSGNRGKAAMGAFLGTAGYQYLYRRFLLDMWFGAGYAFGTPADTGYLHGFQLWNYLGSRNDNIAVSFSIKLGLCF